MEPNLRLLLVEDSANDAELLENELRSAEVPVSIRRVETSEGFLREMSACPPDLILADYNVPQFGAMDALRLLRDIRSDTPLILVTGSNSERIAVDCLQAGAEDYILKSDLGRLPSALRRTLRKRRLEREQKDAEIQKEYLLRELKQSLQEKEALLQEVHHRVKNNLQIISSLLQLQANDIDDTRLLAVFEASQMRIRSMALIHEMLYGSKSLANIDLQAYLSGLSEMLLANCSKGPIKPGLELRVAGPPVGVDTAIALGLIANELITNSLKYAFADERRGTVRVICEELPGGERLLSIGDNGVGLPAGVEVENCPSLGLRLIQMFTRKLRGEGTWNQDQGGLTYSVRFRDGAQACLKTEENTQAGVACHPGTVVLKPFDQAKGGRGQP